MISFLFSEILPVLFNLFRHSLVAFTFQFLNLCLFPLFIALSFYAPLLHHQLLALNPSSFKICKLVLLTLLFEEFLN